MDRRRFLQLAAGGLALTAAGPALALPSPPLQKVIPSSGERIPSIGMGSWITFNIGSDPAARQQRTEVLRTFFDHGGGMVDSSPMYGSAEAVIGDTLHRLDYPTNLFSATKVWTSSGEDGPTEIETSRKLWGVDSFDLLQVHNLLAWEAHLETLFAMKARGELRYVGITTSHGRRHDELARVMRDHPIDFVQATYNILDREVEETILPLAAERGIAFIANRPFQRGGLIERLENHPLPSWSPTIDCTSWAQLLLKFIISHPAVTCAIPATSRIDHMRENMGVMVGAIPNSATRRRMVDYVENL